MNKTAKQKMVSYEAYATRRDQLKAIADLMDGKEWNADTLDSIAQILRHAGFVINEPKEQA